MATEVAETGKRSRVAIEAPRSNLYNVDPAHVVIVGLDNRVGPGEDGGLLYDERATEETSTFKALVDSVDRHGVLEPILVRKAEDEIEVIDGRQRVKACREANKRRRKRGEEPHRVPVLVKRGENAELFAMMVEANEMRSEDSPLNKAAKADRFITVLGKTEKDAAQVFGVDVQTIKAWRSLLNAPAKIKAAVETGKLGATSAAKIATLGSKDEQLAAFDEALKAGGSTEATAHVVRKTKAAKKGAAVEETSPPQSRRVLRKLIEAQAKGTIALDQAFVDALRWTLGEVSDRRVPGLSAALRVLKLKS